MQRLKFYRVEDMNQWGMYHSIHHTEATCEMSSVHDAHPTWREDSTLYFECFRKMVNPREDYGWRFAFCSLEQLKCWIYRDEWRQELSECGFVVSVLEAEGLYGDTQGVFKADTRNTCDTLSLMEI